MHSFNLKHRQAQRLLSRVGLTGQKLIGRGSFSAVYAHPDQTRASVIKITTDKAGYAYLDEGARCYNLNNSAYFPRVVDYHEELNQELIDDESEFRVIELERLAKGRVSSLEIRLMYAYASRTFDDLTPLRVTAEDQAWADKMASKHPEVAERVEEFASRLATFCADYYFRIDGLRGGNSMLRGDQLVLNDPVFCATAMKRVRTRFANDGMHRLYYH